MRAQGLAHRRGGSIHIHDEAEHPSSRRNERDVANR
jgi:hypothetical protein